MTVCTKTVQFNEVKNMNEKQIDKMIEAGNVQELIALDESAFNLALERIRRLHLERQGYKFLDADNPAACETCD